MDDLDRAQRNTEIMVDLTLKNRVQYFGASAVECVECGEPIPDGRRHAVPGVQFCTGCQNDHEGKR